MTEIQVGISGTLRELADAASQWKRYVRNTLRELCTERIFSSRLQRTRPSQRKGIFRTLRGPVCEIRTK